MNRKAHVTIVSGSMFVTALALVSIGSFLDKFALMAGGGALIILGFLTHKLTHL